MSALEYDIRQFSLADQSSKKSLCRGIPVILPNNFLMAPTFRTILNHESDELIEFTVSLNRQNEKLGITILEVDGEIIIHNLLWKNENEKIPSLAMKAGVRVGDFLTGINNEYFSPGVEVQDVIDLLQLYGKFITLHFSRYHKRVYNNRKFSYSKSNTTDQSSHLKSNNIRSSSSSSSGSQQQHKCTQILIEQNVITPDRATNVSIALTRLKQRVLEWDSGWISQRISDYNLDKYSHYRSQHIHNNNNNNTTTSPSSASTFADVNKKRSSSFSSSSSRRNSVTSVGAIYDNYSSTSADGNNHVNSSNSPSIATEIEEGELNQPELPPTGLVFNTLNINDGISVHSANSSISTTTTANSHTISTTSTKTLRPALSVYVLHAEERHSHTVYVIWVMDIRSGLEWIVTRRFREFFEFRDLLVDIRPSLSRIEFPSKKLNITETASMITERLQLFQKFLRRISSLVCINSLHPSTTKVLLSLQDFLAVNDRVNKIVYVEEKCDIMTLLQNAVQVYMHSVVHMNVMDKIFLAYTDTFREMCSLEPTTTTSVAPSVWAGSLSTSSSTAASWTEEKGRQRLEGIRVHIDNLQEILFEGVYDDCQEIVTRLLRKHQRSIEAELYAREQTHYQRRNGDKNNNGSNGYNDGNDNNINNNSGNNNTNSNKNNSNNNRINSNHIGGDGELNLLSSSPAPLSPESHSNYESSSASDTTTMLTFKTATADTTASKSNDSLDVYTSFENTDINENNNATDAYKIQPSSIRSSSDTDSNSSNNHITSSSSSYNNHQRKIRKSHSTGDIIAEHFTEYDIRGLVKSAIRKQIEIEIFIPCLTSLRTILKRSFHTAEVQLQIKMNALYHQSQSYYGIPSSQQSKSNWSDVVNTLKTIRSHLLPHDKLTTLVTVAKLIPILYQKEHPNLMEPLGADEFLPIFIYTLVQSQLIDLISLKEELQALCDPDKKLSEFGYYLATLEASIHHINEADTSAEGLFPFLTRDDQDNDNDDSDDGEESNNRNTNEDFNESL